MWYIIMGAVILAEAAVICFVVNRAAKIIEVYESEILGMENVTVEKAKVAANRKSVESIQRIWGDEL